MKLYRFKFEYGTEDAYKNYWNELIFFKGPVKRVEQQDSENGNTLTLKNLVFRLQDGIWFPYKYKDIYDGSDQEQPLGIVLKYTFFPKVEISKIDIEAKNNGEFTLLEGEECSHQTVTDCRFYLNNWFDHTKVDPVTGKEWAKRREIGANFNLLGSNKSAFVARNTFIKHGSDEALTFFTRADKLLAIITSVHENITVVDNTFTYLDAEIESAGDNGSGSDADQPVINDNPVHLNGVLITFNAFWGVDSIWKNVLFSRNTINLEGPVGTAVSMTVIPRDICQNVEFSNNYLNHTYKYNGGKPGNNASDGIANGAPEAYLYSTSFAFNKKVNTDGMYLVPNDINHETSDVKNTLATTVIPNPVVYKNNIIHYSQLMRDHADKNGYKLAAEHSCFVVSGGDVEIFDNTIDGKEAVAIRLAGSNGVFGNANNPVSIFHCMPCNVKGNNITHNVVMRHNRAEGFGVALRCRPQYNLDWLVSDYLIQMDSNDFLSGSAVVLHNMNKSNIYITRNVFDNCQKIPFVSLIVAQAEDTKEKLPTQPSVTLSLFQNLLSTATGITNYMGTALDAEWSTAQQVTHPLSKFCFLLNCLEGYEYMATETSAAAQTNIKDNLYIPTKNDDGCAC